MGGVDKGLQAYRGRPLVAHVIERLAPQVGSLQISANRNQAVYAALGHPVVSDATPEDFEGPLAGMLAGLAVLPADAWLQVVPCDAPHLPLDLCTRLQAALGTQTCALPRAAGRLQPTFCLLQAGLRRSLDDYLAGGGRKVQAWLLAQDPAIVDFDDQPGAFDNFNTLDDLESRP